MMMKTAKNNHVGDSKNRNSNCHVGGKCNIDNNDSNDDDFGDLLKVLPYCLVLKQAVVFCVKKLSHSWYSTLDSV